MKTYTTLARKYDEMLGVLPPAAMKTGKNGVEGFLVGEASDHNSEGQPRYASYFKCDDEYVAGENMTIEEFNRVIDLTEQELRDDEETPEDVEKELDLINQYDQGAIDAYHSLGFERGNGLENFEESYSMHADSDEEYAREIASELGLLNKPDLAWPFTCIDWEWAAREIMYDYAEEDGYYFRNI